MHPVFWILGLFGTAVIAAGSSQQKEGEEGSRENAMKKKEPDKKVKKLAWEEAVGLVRTRASSAEQALAEVNSVCSKEVKEDERVVRLGTTVSGLIKISRQCVNALSEYRDVFLEEKKKHSATAAKLAEVNHVLACLRKSQSRFEVWRIGLSFVIVLVIFGLGVVSNPKVMELYDRINQTQIVLSEEASGLALLFRDSYSSKLEIARTEGLLDLKQKQLSFHQQIHDRASSMLESSENDDGIRVGTATYSLAEVQADLELRQSIIPEIQEDIRKGQRELAGLKDTIAKTDGLVQDQVDEFGRQGLGSDVARAELVALKSFDGITQVRITRFIDLESVLSEARGLFDNQCVRVRSSQEKNNGLDPMVGWQTSAIPDTAWAQVVSVPARLEPKKSIPLSQQEQVIALNNEGMDLFLKKSYTEALVKFNQALELDPQNYSALTKKAIVWHFLGNGISVSLDLVEKALEQNPDWEEAQLAKANFLANAGKNYEAQEAYSKILSTSTTPSSLKNAQSNLQKCRSYHRPTISYIMTRQ